MAKKTNTASGKKNWYKLKASSETVTLFLYGDIGRWDISAQAMLNELFKHSGKDLFIRFHTDGGEADEGWAIYAALKDYEGQITGIVDSVCASISTAILMACDVRLIRPTARIMFHECHGGAYGRAAEMRARADEAEIINNQMMETFSQVTGQPEEELRERVSEADCWLSAKQAVELGFCTGIYDNQSDPIEASLSDAPKLKHLKALNAPAPLVAKWQEGESEEPEATEPEVTTQQPNKKSPIQAGNEEMTKEEFKKAESERRQKIVALFAKHPKAKKLKAQCLNDMDCDISQAQTKLLAFLEIGGDGGEVEEPQSPSVSGVNQTSLSAEKSKGYLSNFFGSKLKACKWQDDNPFRYMSATEALRAHAMNIGELSVTQMDNRKLVAHAFNNNTHSLGEIMETHIGALIINEVANLTPWHSNLVTRQPMKFGTNDILEMNDIGKPGVKTEGGSFKQVTLKATGDTAVLSTIGYEIQVSRELIMSDKFDFITKQVEKAVRECAQAPAHALLELLKSNPKMKDGKKLFVVGDNEITGLVDSATLADISGKMADAKTSEGNPLYLKPEVYLTSNQTAKKVRSLNKAETINNAPNDAYDAFADIKGLADLAGDKLGFAFAHKDHVSFVEGYHEDADGVQVETKEEWKSDGATIRIYIDSVIKPVDRKGVYKHIQSAQA